MKAIGLFRVARGVVTVPMARGTPFPFAAVAYTAAYGILMTLLWLYERYPPRLRH